MSVRISLYIYIYPGRKGFLPLCFAKPGKMRGPTTIGLNYSDPDADDEDVKVDNITAPPLMDGVDGLAAVASNDDDPGTGLFDLTDDDLREISETGWVTYDEKHSGKPDWTEYRVL